MKTNSTTLSRWFASLTLLALLLGTALPARAVNSTWALTTGGSWNTGANWGGSVPASGNGIVFSQTFGAAPTFTLDNATSWNINSISYTDSSASKYTGTINAGSPAGSLTFSGTTPTVTVATGETLAISAVVAGTSGLTKAGSGTLTLSGLNTLATGALKINDNGGIVAVTSASGLGTAPITIGSTLGNLTTGEIQLSGGIAITTAGAITFPTSRTALALGGFAHIENLSGNNSLNSAMSENGGGGSGPNILSTAGTLTLTGNLTVSGTSRTYDFSGAGNTTVSGNIVVNGVNTPYVQKDGTGTLTLSGSGNTYAGGTTVNAGTLALSGSGKLGATTCPLTLSGGTLDLGALTTPTVGAVSITAAPSSGNTLQNGTLTGTSYAASLTTGTATITAILAGSGVGLTKSGAGTLTLSGLNTYTGGTTESAGTLILTGTQNLGTGTVAVNGGTLQLGNLSNANGALISANTVTLASGTSLNLSSLQSSSLTYPAFQINANGNASLNFIGQNVQTATLPGAIVLNNTSGSQVFTIGEVSALNTLNLQGVISGTGDLDIAPGGNGNPFTVTLNHGAIYNGNTYITQSSTYDKPLLQLLAGGSLPSTTVLTISASATASRTATFDLNGQAQTLAGLTSAGTSASDLIAGAAAGSALTVNNASTAYTFNGVISGVTAFTKTGAGTQTLGGANTYTGNTTVSAGTLALSASGSIAKTPQIAIASGATFDVSANTTAGFTFTGASPVQTLAASSTTGTATITAGTGVARVTLASGALLSFQADGTGSTVGKISVAGDLNLNANAITVNVSGTALAVGDYTLMSCSGTLANTGSFGIPTITGTPLGGTTTASIIVNSGPAGNIVLHIANAGAVGTTVTLTRTAGSSPSIYGDSLTFHAVLTANDASIIPAGQTITFFNNGVAIGTSLTSGSAADLTTSQLPYSGGSAVSVTATFAGITGYNSSLGTLSGGQQVNKYTLTISGATAQNKVFDSTTAATITGGTLSATLFGDVITATTGTFAQATAGMGIAVTVNLSGSAAANYSLTQPGLTATIFANPMWATAASGVWDTAGNWAASTIANGSGVTADFSQLDITSDTTVSLNSARTIGNLIFGDTATGTAAGWTLDNNGNSANTLTLAGTTPTVTVNALGGTKTATISAVVTGASGLTKAGVGTLTLSGANNYTGVTTLAAGTLQIGNGAAAGSLGSGSVSFTGSSTLAFNRTDAITVNNTIANGGASPSIVVNSGSVTLGGAADNNGAGATVNNGGTLILGKTSISTVHALGGSSTVNTGGTLQLGGSGGDQIASGGSVAMAGGSFDMAGKTESFSALNGNGTVEDTVGSGSLTPTGNSSISGGTLDLQSGTVNFNGATATGIAGGGTFNQTGGTVNSGTYFAPGNGGSGTANLNISGGTFNNTGELLNGFSSPGNLTVSGTAFLSLNFLSWGDGGTRNVNMALNGGTIALQYFNKRAGGSPLVVSFNGTLLQAKSTQAGFLNADATVTANVSTGGALLDSQAFNITISAPLLHDSALGGTADGGLAKQAGAGTLTLSGANTYTGNTTISAGTLALSGSGSISSSPQISIATNATFDLSGVTSGYSLNTALAVNINKTGATLTQGQVAIGGKALTYGGTLTVVPNANSDAFASGDSFPLVTKTSGTLNGWFSSVSLPGLNSGLAWDTNHLATAGILDVYTFTTTPVAFWTPTGAAATIAAAKLANHVSSGKLPAAYPTPGWSATATSPANGGSVVVNGDGSLTYTPAGAANVNGGTDSFTVTFYDGNSSQTMAVTVTVGTSSSGGQSPNVVNSGTDGSGNFYALFAGLSNTVYTVETNSLISGGTWVKYADYTTGSDGLINVTNVPPVNGSLYFRTVYPSY